MRDIDEISKISVQSDWRGIVFKNVRTYNSVKPNCDKCWREADCDLKKNNKCFTVVVFNFYNKNDFPIYTDFVDRVVAIRSDNEQIAQSQYDACKNIFEENYSITNDSTIMPNSNQKRLIVFNDVFDNDKKLLKLDYRGKIYSRYEECNWGYFSYIFQTNELLTNGSLNNIKKINEEYEKRQQEKLYSKPLKLLSELDVFIYKRNSLPITYKEFVTLTTKAKSHIKELSNLNNLNNLSLDDEIEKYNNELEKAFSKTVAVFEKTKPIKIKSLKEEITPEEFEHYVATEFQAKGYEAEVTRFVIDGGIDIVLKKKEKIYGVQCKYLAPNRYVDTVDMLHFLGALVNMRADGGFFVTTGKFTATGYEIAKRNGITTITTSKE